MEITKESLQKDRSTVTVKVMLLKIKQVYSNSLASKKVIFVVEGKDDIPYYATKANDYIPDGWKIEIVPATNRDKVIAIYRQLDWSIFSREKIKFFIDRDLTDYTDEDTPEDTNVYITSKYAIENELCTEDTYIKALKYYYDLNDIDEIDEKKLIEFFESSWTEFTKIMRPIMAQILYWKINHIQSNYRNYKAQKTFEFKDGILSQSKSYRNRTILLRDLSVQSGIEYIEMDLSQFERILGGKHTPDEYIRGKYVLCFFAKILTYTCCHSALILPSKKQAKDSIGLGYENVVLKLCGIMSPPKTLVAFFENMKESIENDANQSAKADECSPIPIQ